MNHHELPFIRWFLLNFSTREHFVRFLASAILMITVYYIVREKPIPEGWWGVFGVVIGYYFRGHTAAEAQQDRDDHTERIARAKRPEA